MIIGRKLIYRLILNINWEERGRKYESYYDIVNDLDILLKYVTDREEKQILAVVKEPEYDCNNDLLDKRFKFYGYDLLEDYTRISALTNCGGFG